MYTYVGKKSAALDEKVRSSITINALVEQADYANIQRVGENFWRTAEEVDEIMAEGNSAGINLQKLPDNVVAEITKRVE